MLLGFDRVAPECLGISNLMLRKTTEQGRNKHQPGDKEGAQNSRNKGELSLSVASAATTSREMKLPGKRTLHTRQNKGTLNTHQLSF